MLTTTEAGDIIEAAAVGREGIVGLSGMTKRNGMAFWAQVQISGAALQISTKTLLGRAGWINKFRLALNEHDLELYLSHHDE